MSLAEKDVDKKEKNKIRVIDKNLNKNFTDLG